MAKKTAPNLAKNMQKMTLFELKKLGIGLRDRMNPEKNLRAIGLAQMGAEINFPT